jgi:serine/threonine-protein kinase
VPLAAGTMLGSFRIDRLARDAGLRVLYNARHVPTHRLASVHMLPDALVQDQVATVGLMKEARIYAKLTGAFTPRAIDFGNAGGVTYLVTDPLDGAWLSDRIAEHGPVPEHEATAWLEQALEALDEVHRNGFVHRDVKPANMNLVAREGRRRSLLLAGFAVASASPLPGDLEHGMLVGTPAYMPPEQIQSSAVDARADLWSWGASLYEALAGRLPFPADSAPQVAHAILTQPHASLGAVAPAVSRGIAEVVDRCLAKDPADRWASAAELREALGAVTR